MADDEVGLDPRFQPLRPASRPRLIAAILASPVLWLTALAVTAIVVNRTDAIGFGLLVTVASFFVSLVVLAAFRGVRQREERRSATGR